MSKNTSNTTAPETVTATNYTLPAATTTALATNIMHNADRKVVTANTLARRFYAVPETADRINTPSAAVINAAHPVVRPANREAATMIRNANKPAALITAANRWGRVINAAALATAAASPDHAAALIAAGLVPEDFAN